MMKTFKTPCCRFAIVYYLWLWYVVLSTHYSGFLLLSLPHFSSNSVKSSLHAQHFWDLHFTILHWVKYCRICLPMSGLFHLKHWYLEVVYWKKMPPKECFVIRGVALLEEFCHYRGKLWGLFPSVWWSVDFLWALSQHVGLSAPASHACMPLCSLSWS